MARLSKDGCITEPLPGRPALRERNGGIPASTRFFSRGKWDRAALSGRGLGEHLRSVCYMVRDSSWIKNITYLISADSRSFTSGSLGQILLSAVYAGCSADGRSEVTKDYG